MEKEFDLVAIGNAPLDIFASVSLETLESLGLKKGSCVYITPERAAELYTLLNIEAREPGGAAANTASCLAKLGAKSAFLGRVADDEPGQLFVEVMKEEGVAYPLPFRSGKLPTAQIFVLATPDADRSFAACYGISAALGPEDIHVETVQRSWSVYLDGYTLASVGGHAALKRLMTLAQKYDSKIILNPSDISVIQNFRIALEDILPKADCLICNIQEASILYGEDDPDTLIQMMADDYQSAALTLGAEGSIVFTSTDRNPVYIKAVKPGAGQIVNTNGAGDHYAAGFIYGLRRNLSAKDCGELGAACASYALSRNSARPVPELINVLGKR